VPNARNILLYWPRLFRDPRNRLEFSPGTSAGERTAWIFSYTGVSNEPRVIRQAQSLVDAAWRVVVFGFDGHSPRPSDWHFVRLPADAPYAIHLFYLMKALRILGIGLARFGIAAPVRRAGARLYHAAVPNYRWRRSEVRRFQRRNPGLAPDLVISHDYFTADTGHAVARRAGARFVIDCHEYARGQYMHERRWVRHVRPYVAAFQDHYLERADGVTTVCDGIAGLLDREQKLKRPVQVVRSVPFRNIQSFRPTGDRITVLYLGEIFYMRGLHKAVRSMRRWRPEFQLVLRGNGDPGYVEELKRIAAECGVADRLRIEPPVPFDRIVPSANSADIGYFVHKDLSPQKRFVLPNKYFEYVMAGLALCVSDLPEMARLVHEYRFGRLVHAYDEDAIADVINGFDRDAIDEMKRNALRAAEELNWEAEQHRMLSFYESVL
jgi:glycogen synthase